MMIPVGNSQWVEVTYGEYFRRALGWGGGCKTTALRHDQAQRRAEARKKAEEKARRKLRLPRWLRANKTMLDEGLKQLFAKATWTWTSTPGRMSTMPNKKTSSLLNLSVATNFAIKQVWLHDAMWDAGDSSGLHFQSDLRLLNYLPLLGPSIRMFRFELDYRIPSSFNGILPARMLLARLNDVWTVDFSRLNPVTVPSLQLTELNISLRADDIYAQGRLDAQALANCLRAAMELKAIRMGKLFVGQGGRLMIQKTLPTEDPTHLTSRWGYTPMALEFK
jgi:hypothetical protein